MLALSAVGAGEFGCIEEAVAAMVQVERVFDPTSAHRAVYDDLYGAFKGVDGRRPIPE